MSLKYMFKTHPLPLGSIIHQRKKKPKNNGWICCCNFILKHNTNKKNIIDSSKNQRKVFLTYIINALQDFIDTKSHIQLRFLEALQTMK